ncbi:hypothetical protein C6P40_001996 [Pichia californica]|uniref:Damage-regulated import facilitator 1 n=1 Tax=Pichia californica TaxID=460514 RepID=A0A9P7BD56_9ASCO|nr:hypothetical protein C6P40_001996 [[Candida] californica]
MNKYEQQQQQQQQNIINRRIPLPAHLSIDGPPSLDYNGSTASSLSGWEDEINSSSKIRLPNYSTSFFHEQSKNLLKRGYEDIDTKEMQVSDYVQRYGPLSFNEEF